MTNTPMLSIGGVSKHFGERSVLNQISLELEAGCLGSLLGPSGSGKSTLLRLIAGFERLPEGRILIQGAPVSDASTGVHLAPHHRGLGFVFQDYALFPHMTVSENIELGLHRLAAHERASRTREWLDRLELGRFRHFYPHQISGGEQQRVALARALAIQPRLVLLDEPFSNLDLNLRRRLVTEVREVFKRLETTALLVTHDQEEAFTFSERMAVLSPLGRLEQWGAPAVIYQEPRTLFVAQFVSEGLVLEGTRVDSMTFQTQLGPVKLGRSVTCVGTSVRIFVRPDAIVPDPSGPFRARTGNRVFRGSRFLYELSFAKGLRGFALVAGLEALEPGDEIALRIDFNRALVYPAAT